MHIWLLLILAFIALGGCDSANEIKPFEEWKKSKVKNETSFKNVSLTPIMKNDENRFNYASIDCAAKVIETNNGAKEAKSVLIENKDSYLINKCSSDEQFIVIELCQDILIDVIEMGNFEFFSSNFKRFRVSINDRYDEENWKVLGEFEATNSRSLQKFKILNPMIWAKFLKIEILDHYGNEFYCPISLIKVYGKTMIEDFKEDTVPVQSEVDDECKVNTTLPYLGISDFLNSIPEFCEVVEDDTSTMNPQDSIYKSIVKRVSLLESNASLSLLYLQEQSKLLSDSFNKLQSEQSNELDRLIWNFNQTFNQQIIRLNQFNQFKLFESSKIIANLTNDLSFYKRLILINFILLVILISFLVISKDIPVEIIKKKKKIKPFKVGSTKKKYRQKFDY